MRFGLFYEHQLPRPWAEGDEERLLRLFPLLPQLLRQLVQTLDRADDRKGQARSTLTLLGRGTDALGERGVNREGGASQK